jgi:5-hydroxyisourate hydrolase
MAISTHVTDYAHGRPAVGVGVQLERMEGAGWTDQAAGSTGPDGLVVNWLPRPCDRPKPGVYRLTFDAARYFATLGIVPFHPVVIIVFVVSDPDDDLEVRLVLGPYGYMTFRTNGRSG